MLTRLLATLDAAEGRPVRLAELADRLDADPRAVAAILDHLSARGLLVVQRSDDAAVACDSDACAASARPACSRCPLATS